MTNPVDLKNTVPVVAAGLPDTPAAATLPPTGSAPDSAGVASVVYRDASQRLAALASASSGPQSIVARVPVGSKNYLGSDDLKLGGEALLKLLDRTSTKPLSGVKQYADLGDHYTQNDKGHYVKAENGIHTWSDLSAFVNLAITQLEEGENELQIIIQQYNFPTLEFPRWLINQIAQKAQNYGKSVSIALQGDPLDRPQRVLIAATGEISGALENTQHIGVWSHEPLQAFILDRLNPSERSLFESMEAVVDPQNREQDWGTFLEKVIINYNQKMEAQKLVPIDLKQRTVIFSLLENLETKMQALGLQYFNATQGPLFQGINLYSPLDYFKTIHQPSMAPENCWLSIGAGQMIATLEFARHLMDIGVLPLDFRLMGVDLQESLIWEVNEKGTNRVFLGDVAVNPKGRKQIYILNGSQRDEALVLYRPEVILLNVKAGYLGGIVDGNFVDIIRDFSPIMAMPAKAYDDNGLLPYLEIYDKLTQMGETNLAAALLVMGGFFAAPDMLKQDEVEMTVAGESEAALGRILRGMTPHQPDARGRADWDGVVKVKVIPSAPLAAALQAGGANKNLLTYRSGHLLMDAALELVGEELAKKAGQKTLTDPQRDKLIRNLNQKISDEAQMNIAISEETTARYIASYPFKSGITMVTDHLWSPKGLEKDFINCLPVSAYDMVAIAEILIGITLDLKNGVIKVGKALKSFDQVIERIRTKWGGGTRNNRDGDIDSAIKHFHQFLFNGFITTALKPFWDEHYPEIWKGRGQQEGRNGIGPLITYGMSRGLTLPEEIYEAWNKYNPGNPRSVPAERVKRDLMVEGVNPIWGLDNNWVERTFNTLSGVSSNLDLVQARRRRPSGRFFTQGLTPLYSLLDEIQPEAGAVPEVTRRIGVIKNRMAVLIQMFEQESITPASMADAANKFQTTVHRMLKMFRSATSNSIKELLVKLRESAQDLYWIELAVQHDVAVKLDLRPHDHEGGFMEAFASVEMSGDDIEPTADSADPQPVTNAVLAPALGALGAAGALNILPGNGVPLTGIK